ncbi:ParB N-terminal domain-containing protein [Vibrio atlanticus]|uniref:ParB N-terminal domain-containing protein n=2 Tax=Vibrio atlanticus TaxID=693153 RepID=UPI0035502D91
MKERIDTFIIWPHGLEYKKEIIDKISNEFDILYIKQIRIKSMKRFIKSVYNFDYAPLVHLKNKTKYLEKVGVDVMCIVVRNVKPEIELFDVGRFRHAECTKIKKKKAELRNEFNPFINGHMSEEHIIHASDNEQQSLDIMRLFNIPKEVNVKSKRGVYHIDKGKSFQLKYLSLKDIYCFNFEFEGSKIKRVARKLEESVQYRFISGEKKEYESYLDNFLGLSLHDLYSSRKFEALIKGFNENKCQPIIVKDDLANGYYILDGLHRASITSFLGNDKIKAMVIK